MLYGLGPSAHLNAIHVVVTPCIDGDDCPVRHVVGE